MNSGAEKDGWLLSGNEAVARGAYEAGLKFASAYPGTPSSEILETLAQFKEIDCQWAVNEKVAYEVALSSAIGGIRSLYASKHVGVNVAADPLMTSSYVGINAGFVVISCDDPNMHSSQNEQDNRFYALMAKIPLIEPSSPSEAKEFIKIAFNISEGFDTPVLFRMTTRISHSKEIVRFQPRKEVPPREFKIDVRKYVMVPNNAYTRHIELEKRLHRLERFSERTPLNKIEWGRKSLGVITSGVSYLYAKEMYPEASFLKLGFSFPLPSEKIRFFKTRVKEIFVIEELEPFLEMQIKALGIKIKAKHRSFRVGELRPEYIPEIIKGNPKKEVKKQARKPVMCPGCPHRPVFWVLKKIKAIVSGDIGCYTLGAGPPLSALYSCLCMGSGVTFHEGFRHAAPDKKIVGVIGDSTFIHSGITGLINSAYNKTKGVIIILDNRTTAMTGLQEHPGTGRTLKGEETKELNLEKLCYACGADNVDTIDPYNIKKLEEVIEKRLNEDRLSVIIAKRECMLLSKRRNTPPTYLKEKCKRCGLCLMIDCPALTRDDQGYILLNKTLCVGCNLCVEVCKFGALVRNG
jgi:indolepyruvate ferredoxin oxidoreductase alpha subunit